VIVGGVVGVAGQRISVSERVFLPIIDGFNIEFPRLFVVREMPIPLVVHLSVIEELLMNDKEFHIRIG
jgi:hypothetical protein